MILRIGSLNCLFTTTISIGVSTPSKRKIKNNLWHKGNPDLPSEMADGLAQFLSDEVKYLEKIIQSLEDKSTKCKIPKNIETNVKMFGIV